MPPPFFDSFTHAADTLNNLQKKKSCGPWSEEKLSAEDMRKINNKQKTDDVMMMMMRTHSYHFDNTKKASRQF